MSSSTLKHRRHTTTTTTDARQRRRTTIRQSMASREFRGAMVRIPDTVIIEEAEEEKPEIQTDFIDLESTGRVAVDHFWEWLNLYELRGPLLWRAACIEFYANVLLTFMSSCIVSCCRMILCVFVLVWYLDCFIYHINY